MLETITFHYKCDIRQNEVNEEVIQRFVKEHLPRLHERGRIRFSRTVAPCLKEIDPIVGGDLCILCNTLVVAVYRLLRRTPETRVKNNDTMSVGKFFECRVS